MRPGEEGGAGRSTFTDRRNPSGDRCVSKGLGPREDVPGGREPCSGGTPPEGSSHEKSARKEEGSSFSETDGGFLPNSKGTPTSAGSAMTEGDAATDARGESKNADSRAEWLGATESEDFSGIAAVARSKDSASSPSPTWNGVPSGRMNSGTAGRCFGGLAEGGGGGGGAGTAKDSRTLAARPDTESRGGKTGNSGGSSTSGSRSRDRPPRRRGRTSGRDPVRRLRIRNDPDSSGVPALEDGACTMETGMA